MGDSRVFLAQEVISYQMILKNCVMVVGGSLLMQCREPARLEVRGLRMPPSHTSTKNNVLLSVSNGTTVK